LILSFAAIFNGDFGVSFFSGLLAKMAVT